MEQKGIKTAELEQLYAALAIPVVVAKPTIRRPNITSQHFPIASVVTEYKHARFSQQAILSGSVD